VKYEQNEEVLRLFIGEIRAKLDSHLKQLILFGSRARGDNTPDSDYDFLAVVDEISPTVENVIDELAGKFLYQYGAVFSVFPMLERQYQQETYNPLLMNVRKEGLVL
jgi:predicted nucleotidyltransferase